MYCARPEDQHVTTLRDLHLAHCREPRALSGAERAVRARHDVRDSGRIEPGDVTDALVALERELRREGRDSFFFNPCSSEFIRG